jgi:hypothetical protein
MSSSSPAANQTPSPTEIRNNRIKLILLLGCFAAPLIVGTLLFIFWEPTKTGNYGAFLNPPPNIQSVSLQTVAQTPAATTFKDMHGKWFLLASADLACGGAPVCLERIEMTRKLKTLLGKHKNRLHRIFVFNAPPAAFAPPDSDQLQFLSYGAGGGDTIRNLLKDGHFYVVDPFGHVILRYPADADHRLVLKDLNRLMKYSPIG